MFRKSYAPRSTPFAVIWGEEFLLPQLDRLPAHVLSARPDHSIKLVLLNGVTDQVEQTAVALLAEYKPGRNLQTNVEFYTALLLHGLGLTADLFTSTFAIGRVAGWTAHCFEQQPLNRLIRPQSVYVGPRDRRWVLVEERK